MVHLSLGENVGTTAVHVSSPECSKKSQHTDANKFFENVEPKYLEQTLTNLNRSHEEMKT